MNTGSDFNNDSGPVITIESNSKEGLKKLLNCEKSKLENSYKKLLLEEHKQIDPLMHSKEKKAQLDDILRRIYNMKIE